MGNGQHACKSAFQTHQYLRAHERNEQSESVAAGTSNEDCNKWLSYFLNPNEWCVIAYLQATLIFILRGIAWLWSEIPKRPMEFLYIAIGHVFNFFVQCLQSLPEKLSETGTTSVKSTLYTNSKKNPSPAFGIRRVVSVWAVDNNSINVPTTGQGWRKKFSISPCSVGPLNLHLYRQTALTIMDTQDSKIVSLCSRATRTNARRPPNLYI